MPPDERLGYIAIEDEMKSSYLDYAMSVIVGRALPDVRDGLKPVHRRVLYAMRELGRPGARPTSINKASCWRKIAGKCAPYTFRYALISRFCISS